MTARCTFEIQLLHESCLDVNFSFLQLAFELIRPNNFQSFSSALFLHHMKAVLFYHNEYCAAVSIRGCQLDNTGPHFQKNDSVLQILFTNWFY